ncbi:hypothetical protein SAMN05892883_4238 [Jatrophihabitans sp. GAS493]|uniref:hypothetical protein n=1 Tax=Jatrophihabitans sp. GAS493 TaxID=1907575 RepID=UPI000BB86483|nr:hypothetical protein [Jatrophihabitans sp. GAS493]SOD75037.1 hypothetical protein SAMN05892883_4238 [Jatrophihabitans sp. GAS493]
MTSVDQHFPAPANTPELLGATHAWRSMLRQAAAQLAAMTGPAADRPTRIALEDVVTHLNQACALLTALDTTLDPGVSDARREHSHADLTHRATPTSN